MIVIGPKAHWSFRRRRTCLTDDECDGFSGISLSQKGRPVGITYGQLQKAGDDSPFPALTQIEVFWLESLNLFLKKECGISTFV